MISCLCGAVVVEAGADGDPYRVVLGERYPMFEVVGPVFGPPGEIIRSYRRSPENFHADILVGDFNFDGLDDFSAVLIEKGRVEDALNGGKPTGFTAVCTRQESSNANQEYDCVPLTEIRPHGFRTYLDFMDWTPWLDSLLEGGEYDDNPDCPVILQSHLSQKLLTIVAPYGHCDTFFYQKPNSEYGECTYCAD